MGTVTENNETAYQFLKKYKSELKRISEMDIIALVGKANTGKTDTLNNLITVLMNNNSWNLVEEFSGRDLDIINHRLNILADDPYIIGDSGGNVKNNDRVVIFDNTNNEERIGIVTTGDFPNIVAVGLLYLASQNVTTAIVASHMGTFNNLITKLNPLAAHLSTRWFASDKDVIMRDKLRDKNTKLLSSYLN